MTAGFTVQTGPTVAQACSLAKVSQLVGRTATFVLRYPVEPAGAELSPIGSRALDPDEEITVIDGDGGTVIRGFVQRQRAHIEHGPVRSWVEVAGADPTLAMGRQSRCDHHTGTVQSILEDVIGRYFEQKHVAPIQHEHLADDNELIQSVDDLAFVRSVAAQHGHLFDVGYRDSEQARIWQPVLTGDVAATIRINDNDNNVDAIELAWDVERPDTIEAELVSFADKEVWGRPEPGAQPAAPSTTDPGRTTLSAAGRPRTRRVIVPADTAEHLRGRASAATLAEARFVSLSCVTTRERLGAVVHAGDVVEVAGLGSRHSGRYLAWEVHHTLDGVQHEMSLQLVSDGWNAAVGGMP